MNGVVRFQGASGARDTRVSADTPLPVDIGAAGGGLATEASIQDLITLVTALLASSTDIEAAAEDTSPVGTYGAIQFVDVTLSTDTSAYASGDLIADAQIVAACVRANDALGLLQSIMIVDEDDQGVAFDIYLYRASASWGSENSAPSISDANSREILGFVSVATADYKDLGGVKVAFKSNIGMVIKPLTGSDDVYVAVVNGSGTPTFTASGLKLRFGVLS